MDKGTYKDSFIINYSEGDRSLQRIPIKHIEDVEDKIYTVKDGDTLTFISHKFYGEPLYWYLIADANNVDNPFILNSGEDLIIPNINRYEL